MKLGCFLLGMLCGAMLVACTTDVRGRARDHWERAQYAYKAGLDRGRRGFSR